jgi:hypothetical protein
MKAKDLLVQSQKFYVESDLGLNREIQYVYADGTSVPVLKVFSNEIDINTIQGDKNYAKGILSNVFLPKEPTQNDRLKFSDEDGIWRVQSWRKQDGFYIIDITKKRYKV